MCKILRDSLMATFAHVACSSMQRHMPHQKQAAGMFAVLRSLLDKPLVYEVVFMVTADEQQTLDNVRLLLCNEDDEHDEDFRGRAQVNWTAWHAWLLWLRSAGLRVAGLLCGLGVWHQQQIMAAALPTMLSDPSTLHGEQPQHSAECSHSLKCALRDSGCCVAVCACAAVPARLRRQPHACVR